MIDIRISRQITIITGVRYLGSKTSELLDGIIYCYPYVGSRSNNTARYSVVSFTYEGGIRFGLVLSTVRINQGNNDNDDIVTSLYFHIALMEIATDRIVPDYWPFLRYKFQQDIQIVCIHNHFILDHLFFYPDFIEPSSSLSKTLLGESERYWYVPRNFFDRRGVLDTPDFFDMSVGLNAQTARDYLQHVQTRGENYMITPQPIFVSLPGTHSQGVI